MKDDIFILAQLGAGNTQDGSGPDPKLNKRLVSNLKKIHLCKGGCNKYIECRCDCPRCGDKHKKLREGEWRRCKRCKKTWKASEYMTVQPEHLAQGAGADAVKQHYTCTFCGKYKYIEDMLKHVQKKHKKNAVGTVENTIENEVPIIEQTGEGAQFYGKKSERMVKVPQNVKKWALYAFKLKKLGFEGATETGWKRAKQLATKEFIPIEDLRYMRNWYARHIYTSYPGYKHWEDLGRPKDKTYHKHHAIESWLTWGGNAGFRWVNSQKTVDLLNSYFNKNYKVVTKK
jgi:hypothetical protein